MVKGIHHISLKSSSDEELARAKDFYLNVLGLSVCREWPGGLMIDTGNGLIEIFANGTERLPQGAVRHFALATDDVDGLADRIRDAGYTVFVSPRDVTIPSEPPFPIRMAFCTGPLGEEIELFMER